jgi:hypothetical protein
MSGNKSLININNSKVVEKAYEDILSNPGRKIGEALGTIINVGNTFLWPIKWANERTRIYFENNLKKFESKLSQFDEEKIIEVPTEISMPILERFTYVSNDEISDAFTNLLATASNTDTIQFAHPSFIQIIDRLSPDEAKIIKHFSNNPAIPYLNLSKYTLKTIKEEDLVDGKEIKPTINTSEFFTVFKRYNFIITEIELIFPENLGLYLDNLISLGLIRDYKEYVYSKFNDVYDKMENDLCEKYANAFEDIPEILKEKSKKVEHGMFEITDFGSLFIKACLN